jgi:hypothetical protein
VNALDGCANLCTPRGIGIHRLACRNHQQGSNALAAAEQSVSHGLMENPISPSGRSRGYRREPGRKRLTKNGLDAQTASRKPLGEIH